jgi:phage terminase small subunit
MPLTKKQQLFIDEYLIDLNATQAAIRAGYSLKTAHNRGYELRHLPTIQAQIAEKMAQRAQQLALDQNRVVLEIARLAFNDPRRAFAANGRLLPVQDWPDEVAAATRRNSSL